MGLKEAATRPGGPVNSPAGTNPLVVASMDGARHARVRKLMAQAFSPRMVDRLEPRIQSIVDSLLNGLSSPAELVEALAVPMPTMVICELLGAPYADRDEIRRLARRLFTRHTHAGRAAGRPTRHRRLPRRPRAGEAEEPGRRTDLGHGRRARRR